MRRSLLGFVVVVLLAVVGMGWLWRRRDVPAARPAEPAAPGASAAAPTATAPEAKAVPEADEPNGPLERPDENAALWSAVDLDALRAELPDNLFWKMGAPTKDPEVLRWREAERDRWNVEWGKVLSSTATQDEVDAYYAHRYRLSTDYIQFATILLADYGEKLPPRDVALLKLAIEMHMARLEEIPRQVADAQARRVAHEAARRAWQEQQRQFEQRDDGDR